VKRPIRDVAASVRQRLANVAKTDGRPIAEVMQYYAMERFLYRLGESPFRDRFLLKGALMLLAWRAPATRPTMDIDLLGRGRNHATELERIVRDLCRVVPERPDGLDFAVDSVASEEIAVESEYVGVRIRFQARLGTARVRMQVDVGFGDAVVEAEPAIELPTILDLPAPRLRGYSRETAIAEKLEAMFQHGRLNSRMKDYFDIGLLARHFAFDGSRLGRAIAATFARRETEIVANPIGLRDEFAHEPGKQGQWAAFLRKIRATDTPLDLAEQVAALRAFLGPVLGALAAGVAFEVHWPAGGPWR
jgi:predicted nucleotidyltransferase component of viral defense system